MQGCRIWLKLFVFKLFIMRHMHPRMNQKINLTIQDLGIHGEGIGYWKGYTVFVDGALPGETVEARMTACKNSYGKATLQKLIMASESRVEPICPVFNECGGCQLMHASYQEQLNIKRKLVEKAFKNSWKGTIPAIEPCIASPQTLYYRNKIQMPVALRAGELIIGLYARNTHDLIGVDHCYVHSEQGETLLKTVREVLVEHKNGLSTLRYILIKTAVHSGEHLLIFVTHKEDCPDLNQIAAKIMQRDSSLRGVIQNVNSSSHNTVLGDKFLLIAGQEFIHEQLMGKRFKISAASFFQVNTGQMEQLYAKALEFAELKSTDYVLDAFCGIGTLSILLADHAHFVHGLESVSQAIENAKENARLNQAANIAFTAGLAHEQVDKISGCDVAVLNPPRKGCENHFLGRLCALNPRRIVYISCDPTTLAKDLLFLTEHSYKIDRIQPFEMFPQTAHVETIVKLTKLI